MGVRVVASIAALWLALAPASARAELFAERLTAENFASRAIGGVHAVGGIGDWALGNGTICGVISDARHESVISEFGGLPVDLGHCGQADDQLPYWEALRGFPAPQVADVVTAPLESSGFTTADQDDLRATRPELAVRFDRREPRLRAELDDAEARIVVESRQGGVWVETTYAVDPLEPTVLHVRSRIEREEIGSRLPMVGASILHGNASLRPYTLSNRNPEHSTGFDHPPVDPDDPLSLARAMRAADLLVMVGEAELKPGIAYGLELREARLERKRGGHAALPYASVSGGHFSLLMVLSRPLWFGDPDDMGLSEMAQLPFMDLAVGDAIYLHEAVIVGDRADVASVTDQIHARGAPAPWVRGRVDDRSVRLHIDREDGAAHTMVRPQGDGSFRFRAPPGRYRLKVGATAGVVKERSFEVGADDLELEPVRLMADGRVRLPRGGPMRLVFKGIDGTPDPNVGGDRLGLRFGGERYPSATSANHVSLAGSPRDPTRVRIPPGRYRVLATRGPEFSVTETTLEVEAGGSAELVIDPPVRVLETPGWLAADLHVHGATSFDAGLPWTHQIAAFAAQGGEVVLGSDHHVIHDPGDAIEALGLQGRLAGLAGVEVTGTAETARVPFTIGHSNAFPLVPEPMEYRRGGPPTAGLRLREVMAGLREDNPGVVIQLNHPRGAPSEAAPSPFHFLDNMGVVGRPYRASRPLGTGDNRVLIEPDPASGVRGLDFDLVEVWNGASPARYRWNRAAWLSWMLQGERRTATANSDSHRIGEVVAMPRSYVRVPDDDVSRFDEAAFLEALRAGRVMGSSGPFLELSLGGAGVGERFRGRAAELAFTVHAAPWVAVSEGRVFVDAELVWKGPVRPGVTRRLSLEFERDAFVFVEVEGDPSDVFAAVAPGFRSFAFSNPIFVDAEGDGAWVPPGLDASDPPEILANPTTPAEVERRARPQGPRAGRSRQGR